MEPIVRNQQILQKNEKTVFVSKLPNVGLQELLMTVQEEEKDINQDDKIERANLYLDPFESFIEFAQQKAKEGDLEAIKNLPLLFMNFFVPALLILNEGPRATEELHNKSKELLKAYYSQAQEVLNDEVGHGNPDAMYALAKLHEVYSRVYELDISINTCLELIDKSDSLLRQAAILEHQESIHLVKIKDLAIAAQKNNPDAICELIEMGIEIYGHERLLKNASDNGHDKATYLLSQTYMKYIYEDSFGSPIALSHKSSWFYQGEIHSLLKKLEKSEDKNGLFALAEFCSLKLHNFLFMEEKERTQLQRSFLERAAAKGHPEAIEKLGLMPLS
jgi:TPR repeat protein